MRYYICIDNTGPNNEIIDLIIGQVYEVDYEKHKGLIERSSQWNTLFKEVTEKELRDRKLERLDLC